MDYKPAKYKPVIKWITEEERIARNKQKDKNKDLWADRKVSDPTANAVINKISKEEKGDYARKYSRNGSGQSRKRGWGGWH